MYCNNIAGLINNNEVKWLYEIAKKMNSIIEIGSYKGKSTHALLSGIERLVNPAVGVKKEGLVYAIDDFLDGALLDQENNNIYEEFIKNVGYFPNLRTLRFKSNEVYKFLVYSTIGSSCITFSGTSYYI